MNINKYTEKAQEAILGAQQLAEQSSHAQVEPEHLLVALVEQREGIVPEVLRKMSADPAAMAREPASCWRRFRRPTAARSRASRRACERSPTWPRPKRRGSRTSSSAPSICSSRSPPRRAAPPPRAC